MTYEELLKANSALATTDIKGKLYVDVNQRVKAFRMLFPMGSITTDIISIEDGVCIMKATIADENGIVLATGTAYEKESSTFINKTSYIENCETSAVGRALGMLGVGIDTSVASAEEVMNAQANQAAYASPVMVDGVPMASQKIIDAIKSLCKGKKARQEFVKGYMDRAEVKQCKDLTMEQASEIYNEIKGMQ